MDTAIPHKTEREIPQRLSFKVWAEYSTLRIDIENLHSEGVQASLIQSRVDGFMRFYMRRKLDQRTLSGVKVTLDSWALRLQDTGFRAVEYVGEGRWSWEGAVLR